MVFICMTGENWTHIMHQTMANKGWWTCTYFILIVLIGKFMILNIFLAIILEFSDGLRTVDELILRRETKETARMMGITVSDAPVRKKVMVEKRIIPGGALAAVYELRRKMGIQAMDRNPGLI